MRGVSASLAEQDLAASTHILAGLGGTLVGASLQADHGLAGLQHFIGEITLAFIRGLGPKVGAIPLRMPVGLGKVKRFINHQDNNAQRVCPQSASTELRDLGYL